MITGKNSVLMSIIVIVLILFSLVSVSAIGVTPARTTVTFTPGLEQEVSFSVVNSEHKAIDVVVFVQGELNESILLTENSFTMGADEEARQMTYNFRLPSSMSPGTHTAEIVVLQLPSRAGVSEAFVGSAIAVATQLTVNVPYPGKYAQANLNIVNAEQGGEATFIIPIVSLGQLDLARVRANVDIYNKLGEKVSSFNTAEISVAAGTRGDIVSKWKADVPVGEYLARATLIYDEETLQLEKQFTVGSSVLELQQINVPSFSLGGIAKLEMLIENKWSEPITGAYAQTQVFNSNGDVMADFKSPTYEIPALEKNVFVSYWDTAGVKKGTYDTKVSLVYGEKSSIQSIQLEVSDNKITAIGLGFVISETEGGSGGDSNLVTILIVVIVVLVLVNLLWFLVLRKKLI